MNQSGFLLLLLPPVSPSDTQRNRGATCRVTRRGKNATHETFNVIGQTNEHSVNHKGPPTSQKQSPRSSDGGRGSMAEFRGLQVTSLLLLLQFTAVTGGTLVSLNVTAGEEVTLPSDHVKEDQQSCNASTWLHSRKEAAVELFNLGKIKTNTDKADRLSLTANCSLVIGNVEVKDGGHYTYRQFNRAGEQHGPDVQVQLSVHKTKGTTSERKNETSSANSDHFVWLWVLVPVGLAALSVVIAVAVVRRRRTTGSRTRMDESIEPISDHEATPPGPGTSPAEADPEESVSYASVSYTKKADGGAQVRVREDEDEDDEVTYSSVKS
ncbi:uncharacterized protein LOC130202181 isoform X2 [Pseudoliparis swirei]|uniref:uncharacterized protein LOC130202181 isoform X2 n=1 Tax=Pseudoliparis swirei TaxID=2059687 RepID=UPI0024BEDFE5|nr:uncharacterized protein LOC130202181 isoform X2 [Pseudoliparis swirei]